MKRIMQLLMVSGLLVLAGCGKDDLDDGSCGGAGGGDITFEIGFAPTKETTPESRAVTGSDFRSEWENGDVIGLYAVESGNDLKKSDNYIHNVKLTYNNGEWSLPVETALYWRGRTLDFYAYYPYDDNNGHPGDLDPTTIAFNVSADQSGKTDAKTNYTLSDLMTAKAAGATKGSPVALSFSHALAMIQVNIPVQGKGFGPKADLVVSLRGVKTKGVLDLSGISGEASGLSLAAEDNTPVNVKMYRLEQLDDANYETSYTYRALLPAQVITKGKGLFQFNHEQRQLFYDVIQLESDLELKPRTAETFKRTLPMALHTVSIEAGQFRMGYPVQTDWHMSTDQQQGRYLTDEADHLVKLTKNFYMCKYEVTNAQFAIFLNAIGATVDRVNDTEHKAKCPGVEVYPGARHSGKYLVDNCYGGTASYAVGVRWNTESSKWEPVPGYENYPAVYVTWYGADEYAHWVGGSLPTEAQWEYACRAGSETDYFFEGESGAKLGDYAWYGSSGGVTLPSGPNGKSRTQEVGTKKSNPWGLYDMYGNVWEWCLDNIKPQYGLNDELIRQGGVFADPAVPMESNDSRAVIRGGAWCCWGFNRPADNNMRQYRSGCRGYAKATDFSFIGIRVIFVP